ncbi:MAG: lycopene beta-cyclase CrtY [Pseudomonadota bacterium]
MSDRPQTTQTSFDCILVGGGLASQLIAYRLHAERPEVRIAIVERGTTLGGNHTWSFHSTDVTTREALWLEPLISYRWDDQIVRFPGQERRLSTGYRSMTSDGLAAAVEALPRVTVLSDQIATGLSPDHVLLEDGTELHAPLIVDARGALTEQPLALAYQKFFGLEIETAEPHGETTPVIMDATVPQFDGYRFVYTLPISPTRILVEDTYYSEAPELAKPLLEQRTRDYIRAKGWQIATDVRTESGILPITLAGDLDKHWAELGNELPRVGLRAWLFHSTTGYSLPNAVRLADRIAAAPTLTSGAIADLVQRTSRKVWSDQAFYRLINRLLFVGARPDERVAVMARFYRLRQPLIERFYAGRSTLYDKGRVLSGKPPIPISRGIGVIPPERAWDFVARRQHLAPELG